MVAVVVVLVVVMVMMVVMVVVMVVMVVVMVDEVLVVAFCVSSERVCMYIWVGVQAPRSFNLRVCMRIKFRESCGRKTRKSARKT